MADVGFFSLALGLAVCAYAAVASILGRRRGDDRLLASARNGVIVVFGLVTLATASLIYSLMTHDFRVEYVFDHTSRDMSPAYLFSALWSGDEGSLLLWAWLLSLFSVALLLWKRPSTEQLIPHASSIMVVTTGFFLALLIALADPFEKLPIVPPHGVGLNPLLQNPGMVFHPPTLLAGFAGLAVPFGLTIAALAANRSDREWLQDLRRWVLVAWIFLTIGNVLGAWWAYVELGWGGYWAWDPIENSSLIPWLTATALLHSIFMHRTRGMHRLRSVVLVIISFCLPMLAALLSRSDVLQSVHAFGDTGMGWALLGLIGGSLIGSFALLIHRRHLVGDGRRAGPLLSRRGAFEVATVLLVGAATVTLLLTLLPALARPFTDDELVIGSSYFNWVVGPTFLATILFMGVCTLLGWRRVTKSGLRRFVAPLIISASFAVILAAATTVPAWAVAGFWTCSFLILAVATDLYRRVAALGRSREGNRVKALGASLRGLRMRYGAILVHLGIALMAIGVIGSTALDEREVVSLNHGESTAIGRYLLTYGGLEETSTSSMGIVAATVSVQDRDSGRMMGVLVPEQLFHRSFAGPVSEVAIRSTLREDLYVALVGWDAEGKAAFEIRIKPAVMWIWIGGGLVAVGGGVALWTRRVRASTGVEGEQ